MSRTHVCLSDITAQTTEYEPRLLRKSRMHVNRNLRSQILFGSWMIHCSARLVYGLHRYDHISPALAELGWLSIGEVIARCGAVNVYRALHVTGAPETLQATFHPRSTVSERLTRSTASGDAVLEFCLDAFGNDGIAVLPVCSIFFYVIT